MIHWKKTLPVSVVALLILAFLGGCSPTGPADPRLVSQAVAATVAAMPASASYSSGIATEAVSDDNPPPVVRVTRVVTVTRVVEVTRYVDVPRETIQEPATPVPSPAQPVATASAANGLSVYLVGPARPNLPAGKAGEVSIVQQSIDGNYLNAIFHNNTSEDVCSISGEGTAHDAGGKLLAVAGGSDFAPYLMHPGEITIGRVFFGSGVELPSDARFDLRWTMKRGHECPSGRLDLEIEEQTLVEHRIVGYVRGPRPDGADGPLQARVFCFDDSGQWTQTFYNYLQADSIEPGTRAPFQVGLNPPLFGGPCPLYLVHVAGWTR